MKFKKIALLGVASATAIGLSLSATPAMAASWDGSDVFYTGGLWNISNEDLAFYGAYTDEWAAGIDYDTFDDGLMVYAPDNSTSIQCASADLSPAADGSGDQILTCAPEDLPIGPNAELMSVSVEMRFFADNETVRQVITVKNNTGAAVPGAQILSYTDFYQDGYTNIVYSNTLGSLISNWPTGNSDATQVLNAADDIFVTDCPTTPCNPSYDPANVMQVNGPGAAVHSTLFDTVAYPPAGGDAAGDSAADEAYFSYAIPALAVGEEASIVIMNRTYLFAIGADDTETGANALVASQDAVAFAQAGGWTCDQAMVGIADSSKVINWNCASSPALPDTGLNAAPLALGAGALMLAGLGLVVALRRRARA
jgi:LPXTG-motif cell wall-anchored protein